MIHKLYISTYQKTPIVQYLTYNTIKTNTYYIICSHKKKHYKHTKKRISLIQLIHVSLIKTTMPLLSAISHEGVLSRIAQKSLRIQHNTSCGCNNLPLFF